MASKHFDAALAELLDELRRRECPVVVKDTGHWLQVQSAVKLKPHYTPAELKRLADSWEVYFLMP